MTPSAWGGSTASPPWPAPQRPDVVLLDAPVSGSKDPAERGQLTIFAAGPGPGAPAGRSLFGALGQRTIWVGEAGAGTRAKLVNNTWLAFANEAVAASIALARPLGLEAGTVVDALGGCPPGRSPWQAAKSPRIAHGEFSAQFALSLALKDVHLALEAADGDRFAALACLAREWQQAVDQGLGEQDLTVVRGALEQRGRNARTLIGYTTTRRSERSHYRVMTRTDPGR